MEKKLALIYSSQYNELFTSELLYSPLALAYVGAYTPKDWEVTVYDEYVDNFVEPEKVNADLVAISALTPNIARAYYLADKFREKGIKTVCGGAHVSALHEEALKYFDSIVEGEAEPVWPEVIKDFENGTLKKVYRGGVHQDVNNIKLPRRDLISKNYHHPSFITSKGCPFNCDYCYLSIFKHKKYRVMPVDGIIEDLDSFARNVDFAAICVEENISGYSTSDYENRMELFEKMVRKNYGFVWGAQSTIDVYKKPELLHAMHAAGCRGLFVGLEAPNNNDLKNQVNKGFADKIDYKTAIKAIHKQKITVIGSFILGLDNQDMCYAKKLPKEMKKLNVEYPRLFFLTAWPGTALYERLKKQDRIIHGWNHVRKDIPSLKYLNFTEDEIREAEAYVYKNMFTKPYIAKIVFRWIFREPSMVKFFLKMLKTNTGAEKQKLKIEQREKEKYIKKILEEHFKGDLLGDSATLYKEIAADYN